MKIKGFKAITINALDISIIVVAVSVLVSAFFLMNNKQIFLLFDRAKDSTITVSIYDSDISEGNFEIGDKLYFSNTNNAIGTITNLVNIKEKKYTAINHTLIYDYTDKNVGVLIDVKARLKENNSKKYINGSVFVSPGARYTLYTDSNEGFECTVEEIIIN